MKNTLRVFGLILVLALVAAACGDSEETTTTTAPPSTQATTTTQPPTTEPPVTTTTVAATTTTEPVPADALLVWADETRAPAVEAVAADFEAATGVPVEVQLVGFGDIRNNMVQQAPVGEGADVFIGAHDWIGELVANGVVEPVELGARSSEFFDFALAAFSLDGTLYGLPYATEAIGLYYNTDLVPTPPTSFEELFAICDDLGDAVEQCLATPAGGDAYHHYPFLASTGGYIFAYDPADSSYDPSDVGLDTEGAIAGFTFFDQLVKDGVIDASVDYGTMTNLFYNGQAAFMWTGPWELTNARAAADLNYAVTKLPSIEGNTARPFLGVQGFMVNAFSEKKALAQTFVLDFIATGDVMQQLFDLGLRAPAHIATFDAVSGDPDIAVFNEIALDAQPMPSITEMNNVWGALGNAVQEIYNQTSDPTTALTAAATAVREAIDG